MAARLAGLKGRFILSINDVPEIRETFGAFHIESVKTTYSVSKGPAQVDRSELLIANFEVNRMGG